MITEDSDLIALGCNEIIYKLKTNGECDHINTISLKENVKDIKDKWLK